VQEVKTEDFKVEFAENPILTILEKENTIADDKS
jgi:hypothetical protein